MGNTEQNPLPSRDGLREQVEKYKKNWGKLQPKNDRIKYDVQEGILESVFRGKYSKNDGEEKGGNCALYEIGNGKCGCDKNNREKCVFYGIHIKVALLNNFYSTAIYDTATVSRHIFNIKNVDGRLSNGCLDLVEEIANVEFGGATRRNYVFATKYCSFHRPDVYPICDSNVRKMLLKFKSEHSDFAKKCKFTKTSIYAYYLEFYAAMECFRCFYKLDACSWKSIDRYLWLAAKREERGESIVV